MESYRGIYYNNNKKEEKIKFYEGGAHFKYIDLYNHLEILSNKLNKENKIHSKEETFFKKINVNENSRNIKSIIVSLSQKNNKKIMKSPFKKLFSSRNNDNNINLNNKSNSIKSIQNQSQKNNLNSIFEKIKLNSTYISKSNSRNKKHKYININNITQMKTLLSTSMLNFLNNSKLEKKSRNYQKNKKSSSCCIKYDKKENLNEIENLKDIFITKKSPSLYNKMKINTKFKLINLSNFYTKNKSIKSIIFNEKNHSELIGNSKNNFNIKNFNLFDDCKKRKNNILYLNGTIAPTNKYFSNKNIKYSNNNI